MPPAAAQTVPSGLERKTFGEHSGDAALPDRSVLQPPAASPASRKIRSPAVHIARESTHLNPPQEARVETMPRYQLSDLVPAAGAADLETMVPLIPVPDPASSQMETPTANTAASPADIPPPPAVHEAPSRTPYDAMALDSLMQQVQGTASRASAAPDMLPPLLSQKPPAAAQPVIAQPAASAESVAETEPQPSLSEQSMDILNKIPANLDGKKPRTPNNLDINRAKDTKYVSKNNEETPAPAPTAEAPKTVQHETMGMKIAVKHSPININYELEKAYRALISGHTQAAIEIYRNVLSNDSNNKDALFGLATTYHRAGQIDMARPLYGKLLSIDPNHRDALNNFLVLLADEAPHEAITEMEKLEEVHPTFSPIPAQLAVIYQKLGQTDMASDKMFKAVALAPENLTYRYNLAIMLDKQHKSEEAIKLYKQLVEAYMRGETVPGNIQKIQERLTFLRSNR